MKNKQTGAEDRMNQNEKKEMKIRIAKEEDAEALLAIYAPYIEHTVITYEYDVPTVEEFRGRIRHVLERYPYLVAELNGGICGYAYASAFHDRPAGGWNVETSIYVEPKIIQNAEGTAKKLSNLSPSTSSFSIFITPLFPEYPTKPPTLFSPVT